MRFFNAALEGDLKKVKKIGSVEATDVTYTERRGRCAIHIAAFTGHKKVVSWLAKNWAIRFGRRTTEMNNILRWLRQQSTAVPT